jgi:ferredoxin
MKDPERAVDAFRVTLSTPFGERDVTASRNQHLWDAAQMAGISLPAICQQGRCLTCAGKLLQPGDFDSSDAEAYFPQDREAGFLLLCTAKPCSDLHIRTHAESEMRIHRLKCGLPAPYA